MLPLVKRGCLILPQNGVVDGRIHATHILGCPQLLQSHGGSVASGDPPKRPKSLGVSSISGYTEPKYLRSDDSEGDSLPCSPELQSPSGQSPAGHAVDELLEEETRQLVRTFLRDFVGLSLNKCSESKALATMNRVVEDVLAKHRYAYNGMIKKLSLDDKDDMVFVSDVAKSLFADGTTNWGRIASLVAFGAAVSQYLKEKGRLNCVDLVAQEISTYLLTHQGDWLVKNNSWEGFVEFFRVADPESTVRKSLMAFIGVAGIGATLALLSR
ncbi:induced myeloid leukemia cell differentiation protein Mcl-1b [Cololabis saira]|uniref:induced myeloid leukemia cell differentiation protein Mcl-1b n=1 Tax=Cololabis saira TaxID=129043 RepID=UPI002AD2C9D1|nr:induced myeloid leukemia cell differentiation protein Mcl-1b [Cololabis saira]